jgi:hypothetical protein
MESEFSTSIAQEGHSFVFKIWELFDVVAVYDIKKQKNR